MLTPKELDRLSQLGYDYHRTSDTIALAGGEEKRWKRLIEMIINEYENGKTSQNAPHTS